MNRRTLLEALVAAGFGAASARLAGQTNQPATDGQGAYRTRSTSPQLVPADQGRRYPMHFGEARILVAGEDSGGAWWMARFREDPGFTTNYHLHRHADEQFYVLSGVLSVCLDGQWHEAEAGSIVMVPRGTPHAQGNYGRQPADIIGSGNPSGFEGFFVDQAEILKRLAPSDPQVLVELMKLLPKYDTQFLGPPPGRL